MKGEYMESIKVSSKSAPQKVPGAISNMFREGNNTIEMQAIGAGALNQAVKAIAIARGFLAPTGINIVCVPSFSDISIDGEERTAIKLTLKAV